MADRTKAFFFAFLVITFLIPSNSAFSLDLTCTDIGGAVDQANAYSVPVFNEPFNAEYCGTDAWFVFDLNAAEGFTAVMRPHLLRRA